jgi:hypothetical protein
MSPEEIERNHIESSMTFEDEQRSALGYGEDDQYEAARLYSIYKIVALVLFVISSAVTGACMVVGAHWMGWL